MTGNPEAYQEYEPSVEAVDLLCDRLGQLGLSIGPETARDLIRSLLSVEAHRVDARVRDALETALETIRVATQSAQGVLAATAPMKPPVQHRHPVRKPEPMPAAESPRPIARRRPQETQAEEYPAPRPRPSPHHEDISQVERRPVFKPRRGR